MDEDIMSIVVVNDEEQYSIWPANRELPAGWNAVGQPRRRSECLSYIDEHWLDIRPRSVRMRLADERLANPRVD